MKYNTCKKEYEKFKETVNENIVSQFAQIPDVNGDKK